MRPGLETLRSLPLFRALNASLLAGLNEASDLARFGPGETLLNEGDQTDELIILLAGYVATARSQPGGGEALTDVVAPVRPIGFAAALLGLPAPAAARTVTSARLVIVPIKELRTMLVAEPRLGLPFLDYALSELNERTEEVCRLKLHSAAHRLADYLLDLIEDPGQSPARFVLPYEKRFLAGRIGCSQQNLSRAFAALRRVGVSTSQGGVVVRDTAALRAFAGPARPQQAAGSRQAPAPFPGAGAAP